MTALNPCCSDIFINLKMNTSKKDNSKFHLRKQINDFPICQICAFPYDVYSRLPKLLDCGHTLCLICAESLIKGRSIQCPFDKTTTNLGYLSKLRVNYALLNLIEEGSSILLCENHSQELVAYCQQDSSLMCIDCIFKHLTHDFFSLNDSRARSKAGSSKSKILDIQTKITSIRDQHQNAINNIGPYLLHIDKVIDEHVQTFRATEAKMIAEIKDGTEKCINIVKSLKEVQEIRLFGDELGSNLNKCNKELKKINEEIQKFEASSTAEQILWTSNDNLNIEMPSIKDFNLIACSLKINYEDAIKRKNIDKSEFV